MLVTSGGAAMVKASGKSHASRGGEPDDERNAVRVLRMLRACVQRAAGWLRVWRPGLASAAVVVGAEAGLAAVAFRWLIYSVTWLATGHEQFGQLGRVGSAHLPWLGLGFLIVAPVAGGLLYGPLVYRFAREARGHGVPEVMVAVARTAVASALRSR